MSVGFLAGKNAIITGAASGIGRAAALVFARHGASVVVADIDEDGARDVARQVGDAGSRAIAIRCDTTVPEQVASMIEAGCGFLGKLDCAFNNVGLAHPPMPLADIPLADWQATIDVTLTGTMLCMQQEIACMGPGCAIVNMASNAGLKAATSIGYGAAKAGVINLTQSAAVQVAAAGIRVNAICPGVIDTPPIRALADRGMDFARLLNIPLGRIGQAEEVAELAAWLCSPLASFITGQAYSIDGGQSACQPGAIPRSD